MKIISFVFALILIVGLASCGEGKRNRCGCAEFSSKSVEKSEGENSCNRCKPSGSAHAEASDSKTHTESAGDKSCTECHKEP